MPPQQRNGTVGSRVAGEAVGVSPFQHLRMHGVGNEQPVLRTVTRIRMLLLGLTDDLLNSPGEGGDDPILLHDGLRFGLGIGGENWRDRASGLVFFDPGLYVMEKLNWLKKRPT